MNMKKFLRTGLFLGSFLLASIAWALAWAAEENESNGVTITSDLSQALVKQETVYSATTTKGTITDGTKVRVTVTPAEGTDLSSLSFWYYEPNGESTGWKTWDPVNQGFGPAEGFPLIDGTSYFKVKPTTKGKYTYTMKVVTVGENSTELATATCTVNAVDELTKPYASIGEGENKVHYASIPDAMRFVEEGETINLSTGEFILSTPLEISEAITLQGSRDDKGNIASVLKPVQNESDFIADASKHVNLVTISGGTADKTVNLNNLMIVFSYGSGLNVQTAMNTVINGMKIESCRNAGMLVHSQVEATYLETQNNGWGGVNIDKGSTDYDRMLTIKRGGSHFNENTKIWAEKANCSNPSETVKFDYTEEQHLEKPEWFYVEGKGGKNDAVDMYYWVSSNVEESAFSYSNAVSDGVTYTSIFANGNPVTVSAEGEKHTKISLNANGNDCLILPNKNVVRLYGGAKDREVASASVTMTSGELARIFGGGYGSSSEAKADVSGTAQINISGGTITDLVCGGGQKFAKTGAIDVNISGNDTKVQCLYAGGFSSPGLDTFVTDLNSAISGSEKVNIKVSGATLVEGLGCGGGQGYTYTGTSVVEVNGAKLGAFYGTLANGYADNITATLTNCEFSALSSYYEMGAINRGSVNNATFTFNNCTFADNMSAGVGAIEGWDASDTNGNPEPIVKGSVSWIFNHGDTEGTRYAPDFYLSPRLENANITVTGAKVNVRLFDQNKLADATVFTLNEGKTWAFNGGLSFATEEGKTATIQNNGTVQLPFYGVLPALVGGLEGALVVEKTSPMALIVQAMNDTQNITKSDFSDKAFSIECQDGVIASNKSVAAELAAAGKVVKVLKFTSNESSGSYSLDDEAVQEAAKITNLPDEVAFGTAPITLAFNRTGFTASIDGGSSEVASIETSEDSKQVLTILKPGEVTIKLTADNSSESEASSEAENYSQKLKVTKRIVTLTSGLEVDYASAAPAAEGNEEATTAPTSKVYDGSAEVTVKMTGTLTFAGKLGNDATGLSLANYTAGTMADANVGESKLVTIANAELVKGSDDKDSTAYYELAPITFVKATVTPKPITITAADKSVSYGGTIDYAANDYTLIDSDKLDGTLKFSCAIPTDTTAGDYTGAIKPYGLTSHNYAITFEAGKLTVTATAPLIEITEAKVVTANANKNIELKAKLIHNGGAAVTAVTFKNGETDVTATLENGIYSGKIENVQKETETTYSLKAVATNSAGIGEASVSLTVDAKTPQNLAWAPSVLPTLVYGQTMTIAATSDQTAATGTYSYSVVTANEETPIASITDGVLKATKVGKVTIKAERAADTGYSAATLTKTIEITPKPITVSVTGLEKVYDGTTAITTPTFTLSGVESGDEVSVNEGVTLSYASKNAGNNVAVILPELTLTGAAAGNYTLVQPKNVTGKITKAPLTIKVKDVTRPWNQRHTKYEFEATGLKNNETLAQAYTGNLNVSENGNTLELSIDATKSQNYNVTAQNGTLTITKGMPKAVVYGSNDSGWKGMIVDYQGYATNDLSLDISNVSRGGKALVKLGDQVLTSSINSKLTTTSISLSAAPFSLRAASLRAGSYQWDGSRFYAIAYGSEAEALTYSGTGNYTYTSTNPSVLTYAGEKITPVGVGNATIIATKTDGTEVHICNFTVLPKEIGLTATMDKTYDGTATATGTVSLSTSEIVGTDDVALDLSGISFNYNNKNVGTGKAITPSQPLVLIGTNANNYTLGSNLNLTGQITQKEITVNNPIAVYYNGQTVHTLTTYPVSGLVAGDVAPIKVTFADAAVGTQTINSIALTSDNDAANYKLASSRPENGTIQRSTLVATLPTAASSVSNLQNNIQLAIRETGESPISAGTVAFAPTIETSGSGANTVYYVTGGDTDNYTVVYNRNQIGYQAAVTPGGGGGNSDPDPVIPTVSNPVVAERTATTAEITWEKVSGASSYKLFLYAKKSDSTPLKTYEFDKDGKLKATMISFTLTGLEEGKAYYIETAAYNASGTLLVKKSVDLSATPTGIESISEGSQLYTVKGAIVVAPAEPLQVAIYSAVGQTIYNDEVSFLTQVPAKAGIYVVVIKKGKETITEKVIVR